jgi:hypothetical protein
VSNEKPTVTAPDKFSPRRALLFALPFLLMGVAALTLALYGVITRQLNVQAGKHLLTIVVVCGGAAMLIIGWFASKRTKRSEVLKAVHPEKPWLWRDDWVAGRVDSSVQRSIFFLWVFVIFFNLIALVVAPAVVIHQVRYGNHVALLGLIFPLVGLAVIVFAAKTTLTWRRFGRAQFKMEVFPATVGGLLSGEIRVSGRLSPEHAYYLRLSCIRSSTAKRDKTRVTTQRILWQDEKWFRPNLPQSEAGLTRLPVFFQLPAELPEST